MVLAFTPFKGRNTIMSNTTTSIVLGAFHGYMTEMMLCLTLLCVSDNRRVDGQEVRRGEDYCDIVSGGGDMDRDNSTNRGLTLLLSGALP